ncbi:hypothetical protein [Streptomyces hiroshimensis]|uniref:Uncharacterized protein n=1 Tax=Streptomyces hiroshimensis TaxID=66424 RepID=A0ABQ2Z843_9ACTN|nr:hypothetical protein [Streptomyces hiroshimensis]GGY06673.1 hypothetical protein GCM10010324_61820 [Streptomyces hiroshimensis]
MISKRARRTATELLGESPAAVGWCKLGPIPKPPKDVYAAAGRPRLRPGWIRPLGILGYIAAAPFLLFALGYAALEATAEAVLGPLLRTKKERQALRDKKACEQRRRRDTGLPEKPPTDVFDGDWQAEAGQLLLRWYGQSSHPSRLVILGQDRMVLAGPPRRVTLGQDKKAQILDILKADRAVAETPERASSDTDRFRIRFHDGSWIMLTATDSVSDIHAHLTATRMLPEFDAFGRLQKDLRR